MDVKDLAHRVFFTFVEAFTGFVLAEPVVSALGGTFDVAYWQVAVGSSVAAAVVVVKEYARKQLENRRER